MMMEIYLVIDKVNGSVFNAYDSKDKAIRCCENLNQVGIYFIESMVVR